MDFCVTVSPYVRVLDMKIRILGVMAVLAFLPGCSSWVPTVANNGINYGINVGRAISADRSLFNVLDDLSIKNNITNIILDEALLLDVSADVYQGMVMLTGAVKDEETRQKIEDLTRNVDGVRELFNEIQITDANWLKMSTQDLILVTALTTQLVLTQGVNSVNYRWRAVNGVVYFMGRSRGRAELDKVVSLARMPGVRRIVSHVFLTDHVVVDIPPDATAEAKAKPELNKAGEETVKAEARPEPKGAKKKGAPRSAAPRVTSSESASK